MISVCSAVYEHLLNHTNFILKAITEENFATSQMGNSSITVDDTAVYYRFCGAALAEMLHARYRKRESCKLSQKESIAREIKILQAIRCKDKAHVPPELQYRDRGFMYFPCKEFLTFLKELDACVFENANEASLRRYGARLVEIATQQLKVQTSVVAVATTM